MLRILFSLFLLVLTSTAALAEQLKIAQVSDVHLSQEGENYRNRDLSKSVSNLEKAVDIINSTEGIDFTLFSGDNIDDFKKDNLLKFCEITQKLKRPYYITIGNHDAYKRGELTKEAYFQILSEMNKNQKSQNQSYYVKYNKDIVLVVLDGVINTMPSTHGYYSEETLAWLDKVLTKFKKQKVIIMQHFPLVEPYENLSHRTKYIEEYEEILKKHDNVKAILSGHYHSYNVIQKDNIYNVSAPALVGYTSQFLILNIKYDKDSFELEPQLVTVE